MKKRVFDIFVWVATIFFVIAVFFLPEQIPMHWDASWEIDRYGSRYEFLIIVLIPIITYYGLMLLKRIDPKRENFQAREKTYDLLRKGLTVLFFLMIGIFYCMTINSNIDGAIFMSIIVGSMYILLGNYMPKLPQNFSMGIRTQWTISNEEVWRKTHQMGGYSFVVAGIVILLWGVLNLPYSVWVILVLTVGVALFGCIYSYIIYKKLESRKGE